MDIDRKVYQGGTEVARQRVSFCLDQLEKYGFPKSTDWNTLLAAKSLTMEEVVGALVAAEQTIKELETMLAQNEEYEQ